MFSETTISHGQIWNHPIETAIQKWLFGVPGRYLYLRDITRPFQECSTSLNPLIKHARCVLFPWKVPLRHPYFGAKGFVDGVMATCHTAGLQGWDPKPQMNHCFLRKYNRIVWCLYKPLHIYCRYKTEGREFLCSFIRRLHWSSNICRSMPSHVCGPSTTPRLSIGYPVCQGILDLGNKHVQLKSPPAIPRNSEHLPLWSISILLLDVDLAPAPWNHPYHPRLGTRINRIVAERSRLQDLFFVGLSANIVIDGTCLNARAKLWKNKCKGGCIFSTPFRLPSCQSVASIHLKSNAVIQAKSSFKYK